MNRPTWARPEAEAEAMASQEKIGGWFVIAYPGKSGRYWGMRKREPFIVGGAMDEPGEIYFDFADTPEEARAAVMSDVAN